MVQPDAYECRAGCHRCCHADLVVFGVEADRVALAFARLPAAQRRAIVRRAEGGDHCALIHPRTGRCLVYDERLLVCRGFGLATLFQGEITWCPLNFRHRAPRRDLILDLDSINLALRSLERGAPGGARRVRIADLVRGISPQAPTPTKRRR